MEKSANHALSSTGQGHFFSAFTVPREGQWVLAITVQDVNGEAVNSFLMQGRTTFFF